VKFQLIINLKFGKNDIHFRDSIIQLNINIIQSVKKIFLDI